MLDDSIVRRGRPKKENPLTSAERKARFDDKKRGDAPKRLRGRPAKKKYLGSFLANDAYALMQSIEKRLEKYKVDYEIIIDIQNLYYFSTYKDNDD